MTSGLRLLTAAGDLSRADLASDDTHDTHNGSDTLATVTRTASPAALAAQVRSPFSVAGWGTALPQRRVTNDELARNLDTSDKWITARTGIRERRVSDADESTGRLALDAAERALVHAGLQATDIDVIVVATSTPEHPVPSTAAGLAAALGTPAGAFDVNAACAGFVYGLTVTSGLLAAKVANTVLLVGADTMTRFVDPTDRGTAVLFGDGAGAVVLTSRDVEGNDGRIGGLVASDLVDDPEGADLLVIPAGGSARPASHETVDERAHYLVMDGREVFRRAVRAVSDSINRTLDQAGCSPEDVDLFVPHQANARIIDAVLPRTGIPAERTIQTVDRHGNTSAASVPLALTEVVDAGNVPDGSLVLTSGFGAGLTVGTVLLRWQTSRRGTGL
ncbi:MAG TPA: beta-ketoacyl-ACP synthase III [Acidimicrobiales bacterium]|nr:beta-ketoacyl-ACP synthase III [Acidimicrobiales bacterium]